jgi:hypothetical protein
MLQQGAFMRGLVSSIFALTVLATPALAIDMPQRKAGLWQLTMNFDGGKIPAQTMKQCIDAETDKLMNSPAGSMGREQCTQNNVQRVGSTIVVDSTCKFANVTNVSHAVISGDFNSAYTVQVDSKREGGPPMPGGGAGSAAGGTTRMMITAKYLGGCEAGQKPGDMMMEGGMKMNVRDLQQMRSNMPPGGMQGMPGRGGMPAR